MRFFVLIALLCLFPHCSSKPKRAEVTSSPAEFRDFWYRGKAELTRYDLKQNRFGELHEGYAMLIFSTANLLEDELVERETGSSDAIPVLKLVGQRQFWSGMIPCQATTSSFTEVNFDEPVTPKANIAFSDWTGLSFAQLSLKGSKYKLQLFGNRQDEGERESKLDEVRLEDELWSIIRIAPEKLPDGEFKIVPGLFFCRLEAVSIKPYKAEGILTARVDPEIGDGEMYVYELDYSGIDRKLSIFFEKKAPYKILGWKEVYENKLGERQEELTTIAVAKQSLLADHTYKTEADDKDWREQLGFE